LPLPHPNNNSGIRTPGDSHIRTFHNVYASKSSFLLFSRQSIYTPGKARSLRLVRIYSAFPSWQIRLSPTRVELSDGHHHHCIHASNRSQIDTTHHSPHFNLLSSCAIFLLSKVTLLGPLSVGKYFCMSLFNEIWDALLCHVSLIS
jgi:hypothetical protein